MPPQAPTAFFSYSREDSAFAMRLAQDLKAAGANVWIDQVDIEPGQDWDSAIEAAVIQSPRMLLILSPSSVKSRNVRNEMSVALDENKTIIPVLYQDCAVPMQLRRVQYVDLRTDYSRGLNALLRILGVEQGGAVGAKPAIVEPAKRSVAPPAQSELRREGSMYERAPHYKIITKHLVDGNVVPFLGAGANLCGRPQDTVWRQGQYLPSARELASFLAETFAYPPRKVKLNCPACHTDVQGTEESLDLASVSQYVAMVAGDSRDLYRELHRVFDADYPATSVHRFLATLPAVLARKGYPQRQLLVVTTNYDDLMERAFREAGQPFDVLTYMAWGDYQGRFFHTPPQGETRLIENPNDYAEVSVDQRHVVLKMQGAVNRGRWEQDSYVISEDDYIEYLACTTENMLPAEVGMKLKQSHLLFMGYSMSDLNLRVVLHRIWSKLKFSYKSWAIQVKPQDIEQEFWSRRNVEILDVALEDYVKALESRIETLPPGKGEPPLSAEY